MNEREAGPSSAKTETEFPGCQSLGPITDYRRDGEGWFVTCGSVVVRITPLAGDIVRVQVAPDGRFGRDHSWALTRAPEPGAPWTLSEHDASIELRSGGIRVRVTRQPCRLSFHDTHGHEFCADHPDKGMYWAVDEIRCWKKLHEDDHFFGLGEKGGPLDKRGTAVVNWNTDAAEHEPWSDPLYQTHPFLLCLNKGRVYGVFFDNTYRSFFDLGKTSRAGWSFGADGGAMDYYVLPGPTPADVLRAYARLVGSTPLPPRWALGYQQCRWSYESAKRAAKISKEFRKREIPCDTIYLDIDHMDDFRSFTWHPKRFAKPAAMLKSLAKKGFKVVTIVDPGLKAEPDYRAYDSGIEGNHFVRDQDGRVHVGHVWPGESVFPDFTQSTTRAWWGQLYRDFVKAGVTGIWNDMNEPADLKREDKTLPLSVRFDNDGEPADHRACHNVYGMQMARATFEGLQQLREDERPFVLTRAGYSGVQRYAAVWTGDNLSSWEHLRMSIPMLLNMNVSGMIFCGADIGGFRGEVSAALFTRWLQLGIFYPLCRVHTAGGPEQDPWSFGKKHEKMNRRAIELRYSLMPYLYTEFQDASKTGMPLLRPLFFDYPNMPGAHKVEHEFMFGRQIFVAPVVKEGAKSRKVALPEGDWYEFSDARPRTGGGEIEIPVEMDTIPLFARAGAIIPTREVAQFVDDEPLECLTLNVFPGEGSGWFYNDDGRSYAYERGEYTWEEYEVRRQRDLTIWRLAERRGTEGFTPGRYVLRFLGIPKEPVAIAASGQPLTQCASRKRFEKSRVGWWHDRRRQVLFVHIASLAAGDCVEILKKIRTGDTAAISPQPISAVVRA